MLIYKIVTPSEWDSARTSGVYRGSTVDLKDGFIHFSAQDQVAETARKHFAGQTGLLLIAVETGSLDPKSLRWEPSRGGALFPHLYGPLPLTSVQWERPLDTALPTLA
jgi:uncharacterized protein (DUF952 family)